MMQKHLVIIIWDLDFGGIQTRLYAILKKLSSLPPKNLKITLLMKRSQPQRVTLPVIPNLEVKFFSKKVYTGKQIEFGLWLLKELFKAQPTHLLTFSNRFAVLGVFYKMLQKKLGKKVYVTISEEVFLSKLIQLTESVYWFWLISYLYPVADQILVLSKAMQQDLIKNFHLPAKKIRVLPSWVVGPPRLKKQTKIIDILYVGRLAPEKRVNWLLRVAKQVQKDKVKMVVVIVGDGKMKAQLEKLAKKAHLQQLTFLGYQTPQQVRELLQKSKILVLPSQNEGIPLSILEAASQSVPAIVSNFAGAEEVVTDGETGFIVKGLREFYQRISFLLSHPQEIDQLGDSAKKEVYEKFSAKNLDMFVKLILS